MANDRPIIAAYGPIIIYCSLLENLFYKQQLLRQNMRVDDDRKSPILGAER